MYSIIMRGSGVKLSKNTLDFRYSFVEQESVLDMDEVDEAAAPVRTYSHLESVIESSPHHFLSFSHPRW